jgi:hypothetical protein
MTSIYYTIDKKQPDQVIQTLNSLGIQSKPLPRIDKMICRGVPGLSIDYLLQQKSNNITIYIENSAKKLVGIVIFSIRKKNVKIYVLCTTSSSGQGTILMDLVKDVSRLVGATKIELEAIESAVGFYTKKDFVPTGKSISRVVKSPSSFSSSSSSSSSSSASASATKINYIEMEHKIKTKTPEKSIKMPTRRFSLRRAYSYNSKKRSRTAKLRNTL